MPRFALRSVRLGRRLDLFLVCAVGSVIGNRVFLIITGYPQLGNGTLHISHAIWGAAMMAVAIIFSISFLAPNNRTFIAFIGGCGFGWFIDELGKFITRDVNYFFQPTIALIYIVFIAMYLVFRGIQRREYSRRRGRPQRARGAQVGGDRRAERAASDGGDEPARTRPAPHDSLARQVRACSSDVTNLPDPSPNRFERWGAAVRAWYLGLTERRWFVLAITWWFIIVGSAQLIAAVVRRARRQHDQGVRRLGHDHLQRGVGRAHRRRCGAAPPPPARPRTGGSNAGSSSRSS